MTEIQFNIIDPQGLAPMKLTVNQIYEALANRVDWYELGVCLKIPLPTLDAIKEEEHTVPRRTLAMLHKWRSKYPNKGWTDVVDALRKMDKNDVANDISVKYCGASTSDAIADTLYSNTSIQRICKRNRGTITYACS